MATGSPNDDWVSTLNATSAKYRSLAVHFEKGHPLLVGNNKDVARVRWGKKPHREANSIGKEFIVITDPAQNNALSLEIDRVETAWFAKIGDAAAAVQPICKYMYLPREQDWREWATDDHTRTHCGAPFETAPRPPLRPMPETSEPSAITENVPAPTPQRKFVWIGGILRLTRRVSRQVWGIGTYEIPVITGIASGMIWNRRDVLFAPLSSRCYF